MAMTIREHLGQRAARFYAWCLPITLFILWRAFSGRRTVVGSLAVLGNVAINWGSTTRWTKLRERDSHR